MAKYRTCVDCGTSCAGERCRGCFFKERAASVAERCCTECGTPINRGTKGEYCFRHRQYHKELGTVNRVLEEEAAVAPTLPNKPQLYGSYIVLSDPHVPFHDRETILRACRDAQMLGIDKLIIAGDLIHADIISRYINAGKQVKISDELVACSRVLGALEKIFSKIYVILGNHDRRVEKMVSAWRKTEGGSKALEIVARLLDVDDDAESVAMGIFERFFSSEKVTVYPLSEVVVNNEWLILHPGSCSRVSPQTERRMVNKFRKSVIGGHNHLYAVGFDDSGQDVAANIGHAANTSKFRYVREKVTPFPTTVRGFCAIIQDDDSTCGRLLPIAIHDKWFDLAQLKQRLEQQNDGHMPVVR